jgi:hypothetical protein
MIFGINFELLDELDEFEEKPVSYNRQSLDKVKTLVNNSKNEVADAEAEEDEADEEAQRPSRRPTPSRRILPRESRRAEHGSVATSSASTKIKAEASDAEEEPEESEPEESEPDEDNDAEEEAEESEAEVNEAEDNEVEESDAEEDINLPPPPTPTPISTRSQKTPIIPNSTTDNEKTNVGGKMKMKLMKRKMKL